MSKKPWCITYKEEKLSSLNKDKWHSSQGYYEITFNGFRYGVISKEAWDNKDTGEILARIEAMLNDAHELALEGVK